MKININSLINQEKKEFNRYYKSLIKSLLTKDKLSQAMIYGSVYGGKRIRPFLVSTFAKIAKINKKKYMRLSAAIESIHSYSLIHDDLPSMDDDDYRRGKSTVHKKFNEALAILAGDALHDLAFEILSNKYTNNSYKIRINLVEKLSIAIGSKGLAGGQSLDLIFEKKNISKKNIIKMYEMKTSSLFSFCCSAPFIFAQKDKKNISFAENYGRLYGLVFQIVDDIIDETKSFKELGKTPGKDKKHNKSTLISKTSKKHALLFCNKIIIDFIKKNKKFFVKWKILEDVLLYLIKN